MTTAYTSLLGLALPVTGELSGTWGDEVNNSITQLVEDSVAGVATFSVTSGNWTLSTTTNGLPNEARMAILIPTGSPGASRNIIAPSKSKIYVVLNQSNAAVVLKGAATTGVTIPAGAEYMCAWNGSDFVKISENVAGSNTQVQFNNNGEFGASANFTWNGTTLSVTGLNNSGNTVLGDASADTVTVNGTVTSNLIFTDNTYDIGASGATRPRNLYMSGNLVIGGNTTIGDADTDTITQAASYVTGTQLKSAKVATNTLALAAYDVDGTAYTDLVTLTASNTPTLTLTSTGTGTINNMSIGATTRSTGAFTTLDANSTVGLSPANANVTVSPTGTGTVTLNPATAGTINNMSVGATTASTGAFTTLAANSTVTMSATTANIAIGTSQTTGTLTAGGTTQTGAITVGQSTGAQTLNLATGATTNGTTKTVNIGTAGVSGSITNINVGSAVSGATGAVNIRYDASITSTGYLTIPNGTTAQRPASPAVAMLRYNSTTGEFEGYSGATPSWKSVGGSAISNDTTTSSTLYPLFATATSGTAQNVYTSNAQYLFKPSTGELTAKTMISSNGIAVTSNTVSTSYTIAAGNSGMSVGSVAVADGVTVTISDGSVWAVI